MGKEDYIARTEDQNIYRGKQKEGSVYSTVHHRQKDHRQLKGSVSWLHEALSGLHGEQ